MDFEMVYRWMPISDGFIARPAVTHSSVGFMWTLKVSVTPWFDYTHHFYVFL